MTRTGVLGQTSDVLGRTHHPFIRGVSYVMTIAWNSASVILSVEDTRPAVAASIGAVLGAGFVRHGVTLASPILEPSGQGGSGPIANRGPLRPRATGPSQRRPPGVRSLLPRPEPRLDSLAAQTRGVGVSQQNIRSGPR